VTTAARRPGRVPLVAGNWKMHPATRAEAVALAREVGERTAGMPVRTVVCPPTIWLEAVAAAVGGGSTEPGTLAIGAQTMRAEDGGAYTGETSPLMLAGLAQYVILGHSERRRYDNETDAGVTAKVASAVAHGLVPIAAIGERREERLASETEAVIDGQLRAAISGLPSLRGSGLVIAYEPVWAIGTGDPATPADAQAAAAQIRSILAEADSAAAQEIPILYGGSITPENAHDLFSQPDVDGGLVGGASLEAESFAAIVRAAAEVRG
jgi:triosephosphate isomerase (TIM)